MVTRLPRLRLAPSAGCVRTEVHGNSAQVCRYWDVEMFQVALCCLRLRWESAHGCTSIRPTSVTSKRNHGSAKNTSSKHFRFPGRRGARINLAHRYASTKGMEFSLVVGRKRSDDPAVHTLPGALAPITTKLRMKFDLLPLRRYQTPAEAFWTIGWLPCNLDRLLREHSPDLVHLHWVGAGFLPIQALKQFRCPVVWTLRDMWGFTGGCHYTAGCQRYQEACGACPQLRSNRDGRSQSVSVEKETQALART